MCAIVGLMNCGDPGLLRDLCEAQAHRGPDSHGTQWWADRSCGLGHRRLAILDLSPTGDQPMATPDGRYWITFNGEIYNFQELRHRLEARGHRFYTATDTETIVHLYEEHGDGCVEHLRGMFAFALWDEKRRRLLLARDRLGIKPLYYAVTPAGFIFASEMKAVAICVP